MTTTSDPAAPATTRVSDRFDDDRPEGGVVGSVGPRGAARSGIDVEGRIAIDNGALRFKPLAKPGWGREGIAYGPFEPVAGLAFAAHMLNGHNASQTFYFPESRRERLRRVLSEARRGRFGREHHYENLALGFMRAADTDDPVTGCHSFVMHAATEDNGELWTTARGRPVRVARGVLNVPFVYVVALRPGGAAYYTASLPGATGAAPHPWLRPVGIDTAPTRTPVVAAIQQRILGEVGYRVDSRLYATEVAVVHEWSSWYGSALVADRLLGEGRLGGRRAEIGGSWSVLEGPDLVASPTGARSAPGADSGAAAIRCAEPIGLLHATARAGRSPGQVELSWGPADGVDSLAVVLDSDASTVVARGEGGQRVLARDRRGALRPGTDRTIQVLDDGNVIAVHVDGVLVGDGWLRDSPPECATGTRILVTAIGDASIADLEAHARRIAMPTSLDCGEPWSPPAAEPAVVECFDAAAPDLDGVTTPSGGRAWRRVEGSGRVRLDGRGARVDADRDQPNPGRTIFVMPWDDPGFADVSLDMTVPGSRRGEGHNGRCGVVFWQDPDNYLIANVFVDDVFDGASISTFYHLRGAEDMYDAVWTLVPGVTWGRRCVLRVACDGLRFLAATNGEPGLVRALTDVYPDAEPLRIEAVGIVVNREWGDDTGTLLHRFTAGVRIR